MSDVQVTDAVQYPRGMGSLACWSFVMDPQMVVDSFAALV